MECGAYQTPQSSISCNNNVEMPFHESNGFFTGNFSDNVEINTSEMISYKHSTNDMNIYSNFQYNIPCENEESINGIKHSVQPRFSHLSNETCNLEQMGNQQYHFSNEFVNNYNQQQEAQNYYIPRNEEVSINNKLVTNNCEFVESNKQSYCYFLSQESNLPENNLNSNLSTNNCPNSFTSSERNIINREIESTNYNQFPSILNNIPYNTEKKNSFDIFSVSKIPISRERYFNSNNSSDCTFYNTAMTTNSNNNFNEDLIQNNNHVNNHTFNPYDEVSRKYSFNNFDNSNTINNNSNEEYLSNNNTLSFPFFHQQPQQHHHHQQQQQPNIRKGSVYDGMLYRNHNRHGNSINSNINNDEKFNNESNNSYNRSLNDVTKYDNIEKDNYKNICDKYGNVKQQRRMSLQHNLSYGRKNSYGGNFKNFGDEKLPYSQYRFGLDQNTHHKSSEPYYTPPIEVGRGETSYNLYNSIKEKVKKLSIKETIVSPLNNGEMLGVDFEHHKMEEIKEEDEDICITPTFNRSPSVSFNEISKTMKPVSNDNDCQNTFFFSNINNQSNNNYLDTNSILPQKRVMIQKRIPFRPRISIMKVSKRKCGWACDGNNKNTFNVKDFRRQLLKAYEEMKSTNKFKALTNNSPDIQSNSNNNAFDNNPITPDNNDDYNSLTSYVLDKPYMNIGIEHQAKIKPWTGKKIKQCEEKEESAILLFDPKVISHLTQETVAAYEALACSELMPKGGRNIELALHILYENKGNIQAAVMDLMRIDQLEWDMYPIVNGTKYLLTDNWTKMEMNAFCEAIFKTEKNFNKMSKEIGTKSIKQCVEFYYFWKSACPEDYRKLKNLLRKKQLLRKALCKLPIEVYIKIKEKIDNATEEDELPELEVDDDDEEMPELMASITKNDSIRIEPRKQLETPAKVEIFRPMETISTTTPLDTNSSSDNSTLNNEKNKFCMNESIQEPSTSYSWMHSDNAVTDNCDNPTKNQDNKNINMVHPSSIPYHVSPATPKKGAQPQADGFFHCRLCDKRFEKVKSLNAHMKSHAMKARAEAEAKSQQSSQQAKQQHILLNDQNISQNIMHSQHQQFNSIPTHSLNLSGVFPDTNNITNLFTATNPLTSPFQTTHRDLANTLFGQTNSNEPLNPLLQSMFPQTLIRNQQTLNLGNEKLLGVLSPNVPFQVSNPYTNSNRNTPTMLK
uniref:C2H2-type domain-containing protein n=1 Tax=Strongyloides stercoralis TaxID=6248 RepID=A0A0K0ECV8_STRER